LFIALAFCSAVVWPAGSARPATSNLNFAAGQTIANTVIVPVGTDGKVQVLNAAAAGVAVVVDLTGYVRGGSATKPGPSWPSPRRGSRTGAPASRSVRSPPPVRPQYGWPVWRESPPVPRR
jgi:hypothetical protein